MIIESLKSSLSFAGILPGTEIFLEHPADLTHGDYSTNIAFVLAKKENKNPKEMAGEIVKKWRETGLPEFVEKIEVAGAGFINIWLKFDTLINQLGLLLKEADLFGSNQALKGKKIMIEYGHPNTHKELHIGHLRTLVTGEALARIAGACEAGIFRANYQGDIGPHVAKAIWGTEKVLKEKNISWQEAELFSPIQKAHLLGEGYVRGNQDYDQFDKEIDQINVGIYNKDPKIMPVYEKTRQWSLQYYDLFYEQFSTKFDRLFFESQVAEEGKKIVEQNLGKVFDQSEGAVIFDGEKYGLHKRVFVTANGTPTYEAKEMALAKLQYQAFAFDQNIHVVANEQLDYFKVVIKALELLYPELKGKEYHLPMGMVNLVNQKISSRTGVILRVDDLLEGIKDLVRPLVQTEAIGEEEREKIAQSAAIAAIKYSLLRVGPQANVTFDPKQSVSLQGDSGPYLQYTYARTQSVLGKPQVRNQKPEISSSFKSLKLSGEETNVLRVIYRFPEVVKESAEQLAPNIVCGFLFDLAQKFNLFYDKQRIIDSENQDFRLALTAAVGQVLKNGLNLLGIEALEKM